MTGGKGLTRTLDRLRRRVVLAVTRALVRSARDGGDFQRVQVEGIAGAADEVTRLQEYGLASHPPEGAECLLVQVAGRDLPVAVAVGSRVGRPRDLAEGEVALWSGHGQRIVLRANGDIQLFPAQGGRVRGPDGRPVAYLGDVAVVTRGSSAGRWPVQEGP